MKILFLHNKENWAVHNVGKLWFHNVDSDNIEFRNYKELEPDFDFDKYDYVIWGFIFIYNKFKYNPKKSIIVIHDPIEIFEELEHDPTVSNRENLQMNPERVQLLNSCCKVITISEQNRDVLERNGVDAYLIPTMSLLPYIEEADIQESAPKIISVYNEYPRKNSELMMAVHDSVKEFLGVEFHLKIGTTVLSDEEYIELLDRSNVYICTSYLEGGPIPAMDAMHRGCVVLTTDVGQMKEIITDGENGFICSQKEDFLDKIRLLNEEPQLLIRMRKGSLQTIKEKRNQLLIDKKVKLLLSELEINL